MNATEISQQERVNDAAASRTTISARRPIGPAAPPPDLAFAVEWQLPAGSRKTPG